VIVEVTGAMDFPLRSVLPAIESGKHVVSRNSELATARSARSLQAKKDLAAGEILDGIGGYASYGIAENYAEFVRDGLLPMGLSEGCRLKRPLAKDQVWKYPLGD
jgi:predicted homoserine dehydrogenase-like protein